MPADVPRGHRIVVFGDVIDDIVVVPTRPIRLDTDTPSSIRHQAGGSAANAAAWLGVAGAVVDFVGRVGADDLVRHSELLLASGVTPWLSADQVLPTGSIVVVVDGERRNMLTERGANSALHPDRVTDDLLDDAAILHLTGYSIVDSPDPAALGRLIERAVARGVELSVDPASAGSVVDFGAERFLDAIGGAKLLFPNLDEGRLLTGETDPRAIAAALARRFPVVALTLGVDGVIVAETGGEPTLVSAVRSEIVDPTGGGDAFCAGFLHAWNRDRDALRAAEAGVRLAARAVTTVGGRPLA